MATTQQQPRRSQDHELAERGSRHNHAQWTDNHPDSTSLTAATATALPQPDTGRQAWLFLASCFIFEAFIWGFPFSYGVFQLHYQTIPSLSTQPHAPTILASIGTTQTGLMYFSAPLVALIMQRWPASRRPGMLCGAVLLPVSLLAASFCYSVGGLLATQGVLYGVGGLWLYYPAMIYVDEWFVARKGLAYGVMWAGSGSAGVVVPFVLQWLLEVWGFRVALRVWAVVLTLCLPPCLLFVRPRLPLPHSSALRPMDFTFLRHPPFWLFLTSAILQSLAFFLPALWLPTFARAIHLPALAGPLSLALVNLATCLGAVGVGLLVDRCHIATVLSVVTLGQVVAIFVFWGCTASQTMLYVFALTWGLFGGGYSSTWSGYSRAIRRSASSGEGGGGNVDIGLLIGLMAAGRGLGAVVTGPLSETLLRMDWKARAGLAYGTEFGVLIIFSGIFAALGGTACVGRVLKVL